MKASIDSIRKITLAGIVLVVSVSTGVFAQSTLTPEQLSQRVERLTELSQRSEAKLSAVQAQLKKLSEEMSRQGRLIDNRAMLDMIQQVDEVSEDIGLLRGEIEVQGNDINEIKKRQRELYLDIDRRMRVLESGATSQARDHNYRSANAFGRTIDTRACNIDDRICVADPIGYPEC
jgi:peptidoglycan hydrolase CwlO-like protein